MKEIVVIVELYNKLLNTRTKEKFNDIESKHGIIILDNHVKQYLLLYSYLDRLVKLYTYISHDPMLTFVQLSVVYVFSSYTLLTHLWYSLNALALTRSYSFTYFSPVSSVFPLPLV